MVWYCIIIQLPRAHTYTCTMIIVCQNSTLPYSTDGPVCYVATRCVYLYIHVLSHCLWDSSLAGCYLQVGVYTAVQSTHPSKWAVAKSVVRSIFSLSHLCCLLFFKLPPLLLLGKHAINFVMSQVKSTVMRFLCIHPVTIATTDPFFSLDTQYPTLTHDTHTHSCTHNQNYVGFSPTQLLFAYNSNTISRIRGMWLAYNSL